MQHLNDEQIKELKRKLVNEKQQLEESLGDSGRKDESGDWQAVPPPTESSEEDYTVKADENGYRSAGEPASLELRN